MRERMWRLLFPAEFEILTYEFVARSKIAGAEKDAQELSKLLRMLEEKAASANTDLVPTASPREQSETEKKVQEDRALLAAKEREVADAKRTLEGLSKRSRKLRLIAVFVAAANAVLPISLWRMLASFRSLSALGEASTFVGILALIFWGGMLYLVRAQFRRLYGLGEMALAVAFAHAAVDGLMAVDAGERAILQGAAAVYLTVRAIDNLFVGAELARTKVDKALALAREEGVLSQVAPDLARESLATTS